MPGVEVVLSGVGLMMPGVGVLMHGVEVVLPGVGVLMHGVGLLMPGVAVLMPGVRMLMPGVELLMLGVRVRYMMSHLAARWPGHGQVAAFSPFSIERARVRPRRRLKTVLLQDGVIRVAVW